MSAIHNLLVSNLSDPRYAVRIAIDSDLKEISRLDQEEYHDHSVDIDGLAAWHKRYSIGAFVLIYKSESGYEHVVGSLGIWPVTREAYRGLVEGKLHETDIRAQSIMPNNRGAKYRYWYVGGMTIASSHQRKGLRSKASYILLKEGIEHWIKFDRFEHEVDICAIQAGELGGALAKRFGFDRAKTAEGVDIVSPDGLPVYRRSAKGAEFAALRPLPPAFPWPSIFLASGAAFSFAAALVFLDRWIDTTYELVLLFLTMTLTVAAILVGSQSWRIAIVSVLVPTLVLLIQKVSE